MIKRNIASLEEIVFILPEGLRALCGQALSMAYSIELKCLEDYAQGRSTARSTWVNLSYAGPNGFAISL